MRNPDHPPPCLAHLRSTSGCAGQRNSDFRIEFCRGSKEYRAGRRDLRHPRNKRCGRSRCGPLHSFPRQHARLSGGGGFHDRRQNRFKDESGRSPALEPVKPRALGAQPEESDRRRKDRKAGVGADDPCIWWKFHFQQMEASATYILRVFAAGGIGTSHLRLLARRFMEDHATKAWGKPDTMEVTSIVSHRACDGPSMMAGHRVSFSTLCATLTSSEPTAHGDWGAPRMMKS